MKSAAQQINREKWFRLFAVFFIIIVLSVVLLTVENMLISFVLAFASAYLLTPFVRYFERLGLSQSFAILIPFLSLLVLLSLLISTTIPLISEQTARLQVELPKYIEGISFLVEKWEKKLMGFLPFVVKYDMRDSLARYTEALVSYLVQYAPKIAQQLLTVSLLAPLFCFFMLKDGRSISRSILTLFPNSFFEMAMGLSYKINTQLGDFVRARLLEAIIVGAIVWIGLTALQFPYAIFLALFAMVMNLIPYVGPFIGAVPAFAIAIINQEPSINVLLMSLVYFIAQLVDIVFVIPLVVARTVNLHPISVIVVFIIGANLMGVLGMIISVPIASVMKLVFLTVYEQLIKFRA